MRLTLKLANYSGAVLKAKYLTAAARQGLKFGVDEAAQILEQEAKALVPVDTGHLQESIHVDVITDEPERQVRRVTPVTEAANDWGIDPPYARRIEYGFDGTDRLGREYHQPAQPYMRPAFDGKQGEARAAIKDSVLSELLDANAQAAGNRRRRG